MTVTVGPDGRVLIPNTRPGQTLVVQVSEAPAPEKPTRLTLATAKTADEKSAVIAEFKRLAHQLRQELGPGDEGLSSKHGELLYGQDGLPT